MDTEMTCYESFAEVTEDFYCSVSSPASWAAC